MCAFFRSSEVAVAAGGPPVIKAQLFSGEFASAVIAR